jgi:hypothetical protein
VNQFQEWQLWMYPYPTLVKEKRFSWDMLGIQKGTLGEARKPTQPQMKRCVLAIAAKDGGDPKAALSKAFAICTAQLQKHGYIKKGTNRATKKGERAGRSKASEKGHSSKVEKYEKLLATARGE